MKHIDPRQLAFDWDAPVAPPPAPYTPSEADIAAAAERLAAAWGIRNTGRHHGQRRRRAPPAAFTVVRRGETARARQARLRAAVAAGRTALLLPEQATTRN